MKKLAFALCATMLLTAPVFAQSPDAAPPADQGGPPPPGQGGPPPADMGGPDGPDAGPGGGPGGGGGPMKELMMTCRSQAKSQGLKGHDLHQAIADCVVKANPKMAKRMKCRLAGQDKGLKKDDLRGYVKSCVKGGA